MEECQTAHYCFNLSGLARTMNDLGLYGGYWLAARGCGDALSIFCILCRCFTPVQKKINCYSLDPYHWACLNQNDLNLSCPGKKKSLNGLSTRCCSVPEVDISLFWAQYKIVNIESLMIQLEQSFWLPFSNVHVLVGTHILMELGDVSQFYFMCTVIKSLVNYICVGNNPSVSPDLTNVSISLTDLMSVSCVYFLKVHCFCDLKLFNPDQIK